MEPKTTKKSSRKLVVFKRELPFYLMLIPGVTFLIIFSYLPMFGLVMAFQDFTPLRSFKNSPWVGLKNFRDMLALPTFWNVVGNTLSISVQRTPLRLWKSWKQPLPRQRLPCFMSSFLGAMPLCRWKQ